MFYWISDYLLQLVNLLPFSYHNHTINILSLNYSKSCNTCNLHSIWEIRCIGECPSNSPFLKNNGAEAPKGPRPIVFKEWRDTRTFSNLKSTHCSLLILLIINLVAKNLNKLFVIQFCNFKQVEVFDL
jgi:hypothetical protein